MKPSLSVISALLCAALLLGSCGMDIPSISSGMPVADAAPSDALKNILQKTYPDRVVSNLRAAPIPGMFEFVLDDAEVFYSDATGHYILGGWLYDTEKGLNLTKVLESSLFGGKVKKLNYAQAIKTVKGNGSRKLVVFSDPFCPSCRELEPNLEQLKNVTIYTFLFPFIEENHDAEHRISRMIWCDADRASAWHNWMQKQIKPKNPGNCAFPLDALMKTGKRLNLTGVPSIIFADGTLESGALSVEDLEAGLVEAESATPQLAAASK